MSVNAASGLQAKHKHLNFWRYNLHTVNTLPVLFFLKMFYLDQIELQTCL